MSKIITSADMKNTILQLEFKQANELLLLKEEFRNTYEKIKPINLIKNGLSNLISGPGLQGSILDAGISLAVGFVSKKVVIGSSHNPIKQLLGTFLQMAVTNMVSKNTDGIKSTAGSILSHFLRKKE